MICHNNIIASFSSTAKHRTIFDRLAPLPGHPTEPCTAIARGHVLVKAGGSLAYLLCRSASQSFSYPTLELEDGVIITYH